MKALEVNHLATGAAWECKQPAQGRDQWIIDRALRSVDGLIAQIARRYSHGKDLRDGQQNARLALLEALPNYSKEKGCFTTFASFIIRKAVQRGYGLSGRKDGTKKEKTINAIKSLDLTPSIESFESFGGDDKALSLYDKLADPKSGELYTVESFDQKRTNQAALEFRDTLKESQKAVFDCLILDDGDVTEYALSIGQTKQAVYKAKQALLDRFVEYVG